MVKDIPLAREEESRRSVLLAGTGTGGVRQETARRDQGAQKDTSAKGSEGHAPISVTQASKSRPAAQGRGRETSGRTKPRNSHQSRRATGRTKAADISPWRSAEELDLEWIDHRCPAKPSAPHAHYWVQSFSIDRGNMFVCQYCFQAKWLPEGFVTALELKELMHRFGETEGYRIVLDQHPRAKIALAKLTNIRLLAGVLGPEEFAMVADIMRKDEVYGKSSPEM